jgi:hypothetical protein
MFNEFKMRKGISPEKYTFYEIEEIIIEELLEGHLLWKEPKKWQPFNLSKK